MDNRNYRKASLCFLFSYPNYLQCYVKIVKIAISLCILHIPRTCRVRVPVFSTCVTSWASTTVPWIMQDNRILFRAGLNTDEIEDQISFPVYRCSQFKPFQTYVPFNHARLRRRIRFSLLNPRLYWSIMQVFLEILILIFKPKKLKLSQFPTEQQA